MLEIFPAIDLHNAQAVRLYKGDIKQVSVYGDPCEFAKKFEDMGARWLHLVDLDGAFSGERKNAKTIESIRKSTSLKIQLGGGIRDENTIKAYRDMGIDRLILGSKALSDPAFAKQMAQKYPIAIGIDAREGKVATQGWVESSEVEATDLAKEFGKSSVEALICTDISRDGALSGVNVDFSVAMGKASGVFVIASGGLAGIEDIEKMSKAFKNHQINGGIIVGKAFYEKKIDLAEAFAKLSQIE